MKLCPKFFGFKRHFGIVGDSVVFHRRLGMTVGATMGTQVSTWGMSPSKAGMACPGGTLLLQGSHGGSGSRPEAKRAGLHVLY